MIYDDKHRMCKKTLCQIIFNTTALSRSTAHRWINQRGATLFGWNESRRLSHECIVYPQHLSDKKTKKDNIFLFCFCIAFAKTDGLGFLYLHKK